MSDHHDNLDQLATGLRDWARGYYPLEAAVDLLIAHESWLARDDFRQACVSTDDLGITVLDFEHAGTIVDERALPASSSELKVLGIAAELAGHAVTRSLAYLLTGLDRTNTALVLAAIAHAAGWHESGQVRLITGWLDEDGAS